MTDSNYSPFPIIRVPWGPGGPCRPMGPAGPTLLPQPEQPQLPLQQLRYILVWYSSFSSLYMAVLRKTYLEVLSLAALYARGKARAICLLAGLPA